MLKVEENLCHFCQRGRKVSMMFVFELPTIPKGEIVVHSDCHCCQLLSKWLVWFSCWLYCSSYHIKRFGKRSIEKMFWKRLIETFIFLTIEASRHFSGFFFLRFSWWFLMDLFLLIDEIILFYGMRKEKWKWIKDLVH